MRPSIPHVGHVYRLPIELSGRLWLIRLMAERTAAPLPVLAAEVGWFLAAGVHDACVQMRQAWKLFKLPSCCGAQQTLSDVGHTRHCLPWVTADNVCLLHPTSDDVCCAPQQGALPKLLNQACIIVSAQ